MRSRRSVAIGRRGVGSLCDSGGDSILRSKVVVRDALLIRDNLRILHFFATSIDSSFEKSLMMRAYFLRSNGNARNTRQQEGKWGGRGKVLKNNHGLTFFIKAF